jgi:hypothetical protein
MNSRHWIIAAVVVAGLLSGPSALESAATSKPPISWPDIPIVFIGSFFAMVFVIGFQLLRRQPGPGKWALRLLGMGSAYFLASGSSAVCVAIYRDMLAAYSFLFFAIGFGTSFGVLLAWRLHCLRFRNVREKSL